MEPAIARDIGRIVGTDAVSSEERDRITYSRDMWPRNLILLRSGVHRPYAADLIVWPSTVSQVASIVRYCTQHGIKLIPYGAGSGMWGGVVPRDGGIILDLKRLNAIKGVETSSLTVDVEAGVIGQVLEDELNRQGYTCGHFPESISCSTVGGWIATRGAGQMSTLYGGIDSIVSKIRAVTMDGEIVEVGEFPWKQPGPPWLQLLVGSEGALGIIVEARLRVHPLPELRSMRAVNFPTLRHGLDCVREVMQAGLKPAVMRLHDSMETLIQRGAGARLDLLPAFIGNAQETLIKMGMNELIRHPWLVRQLMKRFGEEISSGVLLWAGFEGRADLVESELSIFLATLKKHRGEDLGEEHGNRWFSRRYARPHKLSRLFASGCFSDIMEVSAPWAQVVGIYESVMNTISRYVVSTANFSHPSQHGCSILFTFLGSASSDEAMLDKYDETWKRATSAAIENGGTLSHHHIINMLTRSAPMNEMSNTSLPLSALKHTFDPLNLLNPAKHLYCRTLP